MSWLDLIDRFTLVEPGPNGQALIKKSVGVRYLNASDLPRIEGRCAWCEINPIESTKRGAAQVKYCSDDCRRSLSIMFSPQSPGTRAFILIERQACACAGCGLSIEDEMAEVARRWSQLNKGEKLSYHQVGYGMWKIPTKFEVDHVQPLHRGGLGVCLNNVQVLCIKCHKRKTRMEATSKPPHARRPRPKRGSRFPVSGREDTASQFPDTEQADS